MNLVVEIEKRLDDNNLEGRTITLYDEEIELMVRLFIKDKLKIGEKVDRIILELDL